eukprot:TRINITY_DN670_c3_g1_i1.p1 TRINITY_DN670_c3_g1~~TRINITY_DN670_c3_g1_i1.p1  ORF type:complete len:260 (-),score=49.82 TRINITY_DN670_c3_g1_i1:198-977(-)
MREKGHGKGKMPDAHKAQPSSSSLVNLAGSKVFVGLLPYSTSQEDLHSLFSAVGPVTEVRVLTDASGKSRGAAFVKYIVPQHALEAINYFDGFTFNNSPRSIIVRLADGEADAMAAEKRETNRQVAQAVAFFGTSKMPIPDWDVTPPNPPSQSFSQDQNFQDLDQQTEEPKLFIGMLPYDRTQDDLVQLFSPFGQLAEVHILKDPATGASKGAGFVKFVEFASARSAVGALDGYRFPDSSLARPITVSFAHQRKRRKED